MNFLGRDLCAECKTAALRDLQHGQSSTEIENAGFGPRFFAYLIDSILLAIPTYAVQIPLLLLAGRTSTGGFRPEQNPFSAAGCGFLFLGMLIGMAIQCAYFTAMVGARGQTLGKMALRLKVVRADLSKVSYPRAFARYWGYLLSSLVLYVGFLMILFTKDRRALHDLVCDTRVIKI